VELGDLLRREERFEEAVTVYTQAIERVGTPDARHWALFFGRGVSNERTERWPQAEADFLKALELSPEQPFVLNYLGYSWVDQGINVERAKDLIERAVAQRPKDGYIIDSLGWVHYRLGEYNEAVTTLERAIRETPDDPTINDHLGDAYWMVGRRLEARFQWERALDLSKDADLSASLQKKLDTGLTTPTPVSSKTAAGKKVP
jgi:Flp pilus assembly protein TadD